MCCKTEVAAYIDKLFEVAKIKFYEFQSQDPPNEWETRFMERYMIYHELPDNYQEIILFYEVIISAQMLVDSIKKNQDLTEGNSFYKRSLGRFEDRYMC